MDPHPQPHSGAPDPADDVGEAARFQPYQERPDDVVWPARVDPTGRAGPTRKQSRGKRFERVGPGLFVPVERPRHVYQRIVEGAARLKRDGSGGSVTGWAALRWVGAAYFDGTWPDGEEHRVELVANATTHLRADERSFMRCGFFAPHYGSVVDGLPVTAVQRALFDEIRTRGSLLGAVQAIDMTAAAGLISVWHFSLYVGECNSRRHAPLARAACALAVDESRSPRETWMRLVWVLDAHQPPPLVNVPVFDLRGNLIGIPDLFDPETGTAGEYNGAMHRTAERYRADVERERAFRAAGIDPVVAVAGDTRDQVARRVVAAVQRARSHPQPKAWTLDPPPWYRVPELLQDRIDRLGLSDKLTRLC